MLFCNLTKFSQFVSVMTKASILLGGNQARFDCGRKSFQCFVAVVVFRNVLFLNFCFGRHANCFFLFSELLYCQARQLEEENESVHRRGLERG